MLARARWKLCKRRHRRSEYQRNHRQGTSRNVREIIGKETGMNDMIPDRVHRLENGASDEFNATAPLRHNADSHTGDQQTDTNADRSSRLAVELPGLKMKNPVMTASGTCWYGQEVAQAYDLNLLGAVVLKSTTLQPREGNPAPRLYHSQIGWMNCNGLHKIEKSRRRFRG